MESTEEWSQISVAVGKWEGIYIIPHSTVLKITWWHAASAYASVGWNE